jgi:hypothetical protein
MLDQLDVRPLRHHFNVPQHESRPMTWQPIESAPKDGTRVILSWGGKSINGFFLDNSRTRTPWAGWRVESMVAQPSGAPTHWQPFPAPVPPA